MYSKIAEEYGEDMAKKFSKAYDKVCGDATNKVRKFCNSNEIVNALADKAENNLQFDFRKSLIRYIKENIQEYQDGYDEFLRRTEETYFDDPLPSEEQQDREVIISEYLDYGDKIETATIKAIRMLFANKAKFYSLTLTSYTDIYFTDLLSKQATNTNEEEIFGKIYDEFFNDLSKSFDKAFKFFNQTSYVDKLKEKVMDKVAKDKGYEFGLIK